MNTLLIVIVVCAFIGSLIAFVCSEGRTSDIPAAKVEPKELVDISEVEGVDEIEDSNPYPLLTELLTGLHKPERGPLGILTIDKLRGYRVDSFLLEYLEETHNNWSGTLLDIMNLECLSSYEKLSIFNSQGIVDELVHREFASILTSIEVDELDIPEIINHYTYVALAWEFNDPKLLESTEYYRLSRYSNDHAFKPESSRAYCHIVSLKSTNATRASYEISGYNSSIYIKHQVDIIKNLLEEL